MNESSVIRDIIDEHFVYDQAYETFRSNLPTLDDWTTFLDDLGISDADKTAVRKSWQLYLELARKRSPSKQEWTTAEIPEAEFREGLERLEDERKRPYAIKALKDLTNHPLPSTDILDELVETAMVAEDEEVEAEYTSILRNVTYSTPDLVKERQEDIVSFSLDQFEKSDDVKVRQHAWSILTRLLPSALDEERARQLWGMANSLLAESVDEDDDDKLHHADRVVRELADDWITGQDELLKELRNETWEKLGESDDLDSAYDEWLGQFREARGIGQS